MKYYRTQQQIAQEIAQELAQEVSAIKAQQMGCTGGITAFWWSVVKNPILNEAALAIPDEETELAEGETVKTLYKNGDFIITTDDLVEHGVLETEGWFASPSAI
jgi:hypothetical protein